MLLLLGLMEFALTPDYLQLVGKYFSSEEKYLEGGGHDDTTSKDRLMSRIVISALCSLCRL